MKNYFIILFLIVPLLFLSCEKDVSTSPEEIFINKNNIFVDSNPQGASIFVDNRNSGQKTPDTITWIDDGEHLITLKKPYFSDFSYMINVGGNELDSIFFDYTVNPLMYGKLYIDSDPRNADIYIDDVYTGFKTPKLFEGLFPALYQITYKLPNYWDMQTTAIVYSDRSITVDKKLVDSILWVNYNVATVGLPGNFFNCIDIQNGYIKWAGSYGSGLLRYDDNEWTVFNTSNSAIPSDFITSIKAGANEIWIGTDNGAAMYSNGTFQVYNSANSPLSDKIEAVETGPDGKAWIGTFNKGVFVLNGGAWTNYTASNSPLPVNYIKSIMLDANGTAWIGTDGGGLAQFDGTNWTIHYNDLPPSKNVKSVFLNNTDLWVGCIFAGMTPGGIARKRNNSWTLFEEGGYNIFGIAMHPQNTMWFASFEVGLVRYNEGFHYFTVMNSRIPSNRVTDIAIDGAGNKWITTYERGIAKYKGE